MSRFSDIFGDEHGNQLHRFGFGNYTIHFEAPYDLVPYDRVLSRDLNFKTIVAQYFTAHPDLKCRLTRKADGNERKGERSVTLVAAELLSPQGELLSVEQVFETRFRERLANKKTFQPKGKPWRLCFQLEEPTLDEENPAKEQMWFVRFFFQATDDLSLLRSP